MSRAGLLALALVLPACGPPPPAAGGNANSPGDSVHQLTGEIAVAGSVPTQRVVLRTDEPRQVTIDGPLVDELRNIAGARVAVAGSGTADRFHVESYRMLSVDGRPVVAGVLERAGDGSLWLRTDDDRLYHLHDPPPGVRPGQKIWVEGAATLRVERHGVIREP